MNTQPQLACRDERRRGLVRHSRWNGIDYVEVANVAQTELAVHLFHDAPGSLDRLLPIIEGGRRIRGITVTDFRLDDEEKDCLRLKVDRAGDFSTYTLKLVAAIDGKPASDPAAGFDPRYAQAQFSFKVDCPGDLDCKTDRICPPEIRDEPEINYLAKDYGSFRQLILDRLALIMPGWQERHVPDTGIALVEILAYVGDYLSYYQDAVATEAYLDTARRRISVRRHARLVDYAMHEGCNARAWVCMELTSRDHYDLGPDAWFVTGAAHSATQGVIARAEFDRLPPQPRVVFLPLGYESKIPLYRAHNELKFYTWGDSLCCLPRGATRATLKYEWKSSENATGHPERRETSHDTDALRRSPPPPEPPPPGDLPLKAGDVLIIEEIRGVETGNPADADPAHRCAVRLTKVVPAVDPLNGRHIVEIEWAVEDALPFTFCLSTRLAAPDCRFVEDICVARGNVILVDHGRPTEDPPWQVPCGRQVGECACEGSPVEMTEVPGESDAKLTQRSLTFSQPLARGAPAASTLLKQDPRRALPAVRVRGWPGICPNPDDPPARPKLRDPDNRESNDARWDWLPRPDLLRSNGSEPHFVVEMDNEGIAHLRFGDNRSGHQPEAGLVMSARYRIGNGVAGNVGAETITTLVLPGPVDGLDLRPRNPLPAQGGVDAEPIADVKLFAPGAFKKVLARAITADDYARLAEREFKSEVQRAGAQLKWTGSWVEVQVAIDALGTDAAPPALLRRIERRLQRYRRIGHDLKVVTARLVPLDLELKVCVLPHYLRGHVEAELLEVFSTRTRRDGRTGFFHPDNLTFGEGIYVSKLVAAAQAVAGVESVRVVRLQRYAEDDHGERDAGILRLDPLEVAQLDNDPSFPEHGRLVLTMGGGR